MGKRLFIGLLILFAVLYLASVTLGFATFGTEKERENERSGLMSSGSGGSAILDRLTSLFAPPLVVRPIDCSGRSEDRTIRLSASTPRCELRVRAGKGDDYASGELRYSAGAGIWWVVNGGQPKGCATVHGGAGNAAAPRLLVEYIPSDRQELDEAKKLNPACRKQDAERAATLTVTGDGGNLILSCVGCDQQTDRTIRVSIE